MSNEETLKAKVRTPSKSEVFSMAREMGIKTGHMVNVAKPIMKRRHKSKEQLIRDIQLAEDNIACFKTDTMCNATDCLWFKECQK